MHTSQHTARKARSVWTPSVVSSFILCAGALGQEPPTKADDPFPPGTPAIQGVSPEKLASLAELIQSFVDSQEIVGAELLVIKDGYTLLHQGFGWSDQEEQAAMGTGKVFCVRSMTKPLIGMSIMILVDENLLELDDPIAKHLPCFDQEGLDEITVEQLLTHTGGLPMSLLLREDLKALSGIQEVAALMESSLLQSAPGEKLHYSDQGTDTLTAVLEKVTGMPAADFVHTRILDPLGMTQSTAVMERDNELRSITCSKYMRMDGHWDRFWSPADAELFPFFLGSQGLYSTLTDYARFMDLWANKGRLGRERLLGSRYVRKALTPSGFPMRASSGFGGLTPKYGFLMQLWVNSDEEGEDVVAFGHTGSDGTHAWVFPKQKAMVLYFTQSRGTTTGLQVEAALDEIFLGAPFNPVQPNPDVTPYLGYYQDEPNDSYRAIIRDGDGMSMDIVGKGVVPLEYLGNDRWRPKPSPRETLEFTRTESGAVSGYTSGSHREYRFEPAADLPSVTALSKQVAAAHKMHLLESVGPVRLTGTLEIQSQNLTGEFVSILQWPASFRTNFRAGEIYEFNSFDGEHGWYATNNVPAEKLTGIRAEQAHIDSPFLRMGNWVEHYDDIEVVQRMHEGDDSALVVRIGGLDKPGYTLFVEEGTGLIRMAAAIVDIPGLGRTAMRSQFGGFRAVGGAQMPMEAKIHFNHSLIGTMALEFSEVELGIELAEGVFQLKD